MEDPFFVNPWTPGHRRPYFRSPSQAPSPKPKVISIPVHFVGSETEKKRRPSASDRSVAAAVRIQKAVRGFLVRNNVRAVRKIAAEAEEIAQRISPEAIRRDPREQLRIGEMLMKLLLRLDSIRCVREYRRKVIRRVIQLQEAVDSAAAAAAAAAAAGPPPESVEMTGEGEIDPAEDTETLETPELPDPVMETQEIGETEKCLVADLMDEAASDCAGTEDSTLTGANNETEILTEDFEVESPGRNFKGGENSEIHKITEDSAEQATEERIIAKEEDNKDEEGDLMMHGVVSAVGDSAAKEVMERVVAESERLQSLVAELCQRSAQQCQLMSGLVQRVEQLEQTVQRMERRRKKRQANNSASLDNKCGRTKQ